jgi:hypothetical protein
MNGLIRWNLAEVEKLVELTHYAKVHNKMFGHRKEIPGLILVKDQGIYLISTKTYPKGKSPATEGEVLYAKGFGPDADWDKVQSAAGGDDFAELLPLTDLDKIINTLKDQKIDLNQARLVVEFSDRCFKIGVGVKK